MNKKFTKQFLTFILVALVTFLSSNIFATNGYFRHGYGVKYSGLAGAGVALPMSSLGVTTNPAVLSFLPKRFDINFAVFTPNRSFNVAGTASGMEGTFGLKNGKVESESNYFYFPTFGTNFKIGNKISLGVAFFGNGGMNTDYNSAVFYDQASKSTGVNLEQMFFGVTIAYKINCKHSIGATALYGYQRFSAKGLTAFSNFSSSPANLTGNSVSTAGGFGVRIGYLGKLNKIISIGASYQTKINMSKFERYSGLFAEQGDFDIPANWTAGFALNFSKISFAVDIQQILYSGVKSISNPVNPMALPPMFPDGSGGYVNNPNHIPLGADEGSGFGWKDMTIFKIGAVYKGIKGLDLLVGYSYGKNPVPNTEALFNILAPGIIEHHITAGISKKLSCGKEINFTIMYAPESTLKGANNFDSFGNQTIELSMSQLQFEVGYSF